MNEPEVHPAPDWGSISEEILCPLCDYNLRGVADPRCAECGYRFDWADMLDPQRRQHPYLFEHHPRRKLWSFFRTLAATCLPWQFWKKLHATQNVVPGRCVTYFLLCLLPWPIMSITAWIIVLVEVYLDNLAQRAKLLSQWNLATGQSGWFRDRIIQEYGSLTAYLDASCPVSLSGLVRQVFVDHELLWIWIVPTLAVISWPIVSYAALHCFAMTMKKAQIKSTHIWRCVIYSGDAIAWLLLAAIMTLIGMHLASPMTTSDVIKYVAFFGAAAGELVLPIGTIRLCLAYKYYLRFERPVATVLLAQAIVLLFYVNVSMIPVWL